MMLKSPAPTLHKTTRTEITPLFGEAKLVLDETPKAISPFGGLASFISFLGQISFARAVQEHLPFAAPASNNAIPLAHSLTAFLSHASPQCYPQYRGNPNQELPTDAIL